MLNEVKTT